MRYIRPAASNREDKQNALVNEVGKQRMEELKLQIKSAYTQISMLKESNKKLTWKVEAMEKQMQSLGLIKQEMQFLKEQENNFKQQLSNQDEINRKLRDQLEKAEKERNELSERLRAFSGGEEAKLTSRMQTNRSEKASLKEELGARLHEYKSLKTPYETSARTSICMMSVSNERSKQNHHSTPKSKLKISLDHLMAPDNPNQRKKVFF